MCFYKYILIVLMSYSVVVIADSYRGYVPPLASEALLNPAKTKEQIERENYEAERVIHSVEIGAHDFHKLNKAANEIISQYEAKHINADDFIIKMYLLVPSASGKAHIPDMIQWTQEYPASYAAWYVLGRQYLNIAKAARGGKWANETAEEQFSEMDKYARLSHDALLKSLDLYSRPMPSYRTLIQTHHYINKADVGKDYEYLQAAVEADPDSTLIYNLFFTYNRPRWGGSFDLLTSVLKKAKATGISEKNYTKLEAYLIELYADYARDLQKNPSVASEMYIKAFNINPISENLFRIHLAAQQAKKANDIDGALALYKEIIDKDPLDHEAYFRRGAILREEGRDIKLHFSDMIESAKLGNMYAQNNIGYYYLTGDKGFPVNLKQAKAWLQLSANQGYSHARRKLLVVEDKLKKQIKQKYVHQDSNEEN